MLLLELVVTTSNDNTFEASSRLRVLFDRWFICMSTSLSDNHTPSSFFLPSPPLTKHWRLGDAKAHYSPLGIAWCAEGRSCGRSVRYIFFPKHSLLSRKPLSHRA